MFKIYDGRECFYQWDLNRKLIIESPDIKEVHFCNKVGNCSLVRQVYEVNGLYLVDVPNLILQQSFRMSVYGYDTNYTKYSTTFEIKARTRPESYVYTDEEQETWSELDRRITALEKTGGADLTGYATEEYVNKAIEAIDIPEVDLTGYYTKAEIDNAGYQTAADVETAINNAFSTIGIAEEGAY